MMKGLAALAASAGAGMAISIYLTYTHFQPAALACSAGSVVDCATVTSSRWSVIPGTQAPVALLGLAFFAVSLALVVPALQGHDGLWLRMLHLAWSTGALAFVIYLVYAELVLVHRICEWCSAVHLLVVATFLLSAIRLQVVRASDSGP